ncbi:hypothetical protein FB645_001904 [Coemansia sp. IMI 203386]|nr:hypothetical protein FB645_001904 [Coemansia sp. IMI 203386]
MANINSLPSSIVEKILKQTLDVYDLTSWSWQNQLRLLAVCRQWREIAQPHVHEMCFIKLREEFGYDSDVSDSGTDIDDSYVLLDTNIDNVAANGLCHWAKHMHISLLWPSNPLAYINEVISKLQTSNAQWSSVTKLTVWLTSSTSDLDTAERLKSEPLDNAVIKSAQVLLEQLPNISRLNIRAYTMNGLAEIFVSQLAAHYAPQLRTLKCNIPLPLSPLHFSDILAHLDLQFGPETGGLLSQVHAGSLQSIVLSNVPVDFAWRYFIGDAADGKGNIAFRQLESMSLSYAGQLNRHRDVNADDPYCLHFPKLKNISIQGCPENCEILYAKAYLSKMNSISITGSYSAIRALAAMDIVSADSLFISITSISGQDIDDVFYETTNRLYGQSLVSRWSKLVIPRCSRSLDPRQIGWCNMTELVCHDCIEFNSLVELIPRLPQAKKLSFAQITFEEDPLGIVEESVFAKQLVSPFDSCLKDMYLYIDTEVYPAALAAVKHLLVRIPSLSRVYLPHDMHLVMEKFVKRAQFEYRHLSKVKIEHAFSR